MVTSATSRWSLREACDTPDSFTVTDNLTKRARTFHVPNFNFVELIEGEAYVHTTRSKVMKLNLASGERVFLPENTETNRWDLSKISKSSSCFSVRDNLAKRERTFHVPNLDHVELIEDEAYAYTSQSRVMKIDLASGVRVFLPKGVTSERWHLSKICQTSNSFTVLDNHTGRERSFHIPHLDSVELFENLAYIHTKQSRIMQLDLSSGVRAFMAQS